MTSATLSVNGSFEHYINELGWGHVEHKQLPSSFDYLKQAQLYVPRMLPSPNNKLHTEAVIQAVLPLLEVTQGRAFLLFQYDSHGSPVAFVYSCTAVFFNTTNLITFTVDCLDQYGIHYRNG